MVAFIFGGDTNETPETIKRKREIARALMASQGAPRNIGEGLNALGDGIVSAVLDRRAASAEKAGLEAAARDFAPIASMFGGGAGGGIPQMGSEAAAASTDNGRVGSTIDFARGEAGGASPDVAGLESYIRDAATKRGIDPDVAVKVARSEGLGPGIWQSNYVKNGKRETSYGPFQLLVGGGLGDKFQKTYGKSPADPSTVYNQIDFALDEAAQGGWSPWYGAAKVGVGNRTGLDNARALGYQPTEVASLDPSIGMPGAAGEVDATAPQPQPQPTPATVPAQAAAGGQVAQALTQSQPGSTVDTGAILKALSNPWLPEGQRAVAQALLQQENARRQAVAEQQLKQADPKYQMEIQKGQIELENLRNPKISPADQARIDLERQKYDFERGKPTEVGGRLIGQDGKVIYEPPRDPTKVGQGETLVGADGKVIFKADAKPEPKPSAVQEYEYAKAQGFPGTFQDWEASKKGGMSLNVDPATGAVTFQQGGNIKPMTEGQSKDAVFSTRAEGALKLINEFGNALTGSEGMIGGTVGQLPIVGNYAKSGDFQQAEQAGKEFLQAILRKDTGAAITKDETAEYGTVYLPRPGDSPELLKQKAASRIRALEAIKAGMPPQAILAQEKALANTEKAAGADAAPEGVDADLWKHMTPEEKALWQN